MVEGQRQSLAEQLKTGRVKERQDLAQAIQAVDHIQQSLSTTLAVESRLRQFPNCQALQSHPWFCFLAMPSGEPYLWLR